MCAIVCLMGMYHNPFCLFLCPCMTMVSLWTMLHSSWEKTTLHPASHSFVTDMREWFFIPGMTYPCFAVLGRGRSSLHACDERRVDWSGRVTWMGWCRVVFAFTFAVGVK